MEEEVSVSRLHASPLPFHPDRPLVFPAAASAAPDWTEADKDGYGTSTTTASKVWHTLDDGRLTEVFYPDLGTPSVRTPEFVVTDGAFSATPLAWSHAQYVRLAWSIAAGHPLEQPSIVADRYGN